ncbi:aldo/keto reductase [Wolfiporia cocos MD-104 SS10]|uniref:Aldo/keto reductase n=1 Tax=Wolfiporia cocos (strain MD-104) TaxID=742152 RepID=A0A2H3J824_WOLCO|nr:aldo/keto reductase [Wolfiporia cocos MD-104 SS10]
MVQNTAKLGGSASGITVGRVAHGIMMMTLRDPTTPLSDEEAFEAIKAGVDALPPGTKAFLNSGEFYGPNLSTANLELLARFYEKYPDYADKTFISVKGGNKPGTFHVDSSPENIRRSVDTINNALRGTKKLDLFQSARVDPNIPIEDTIKVLAELVKEGKFNHIGISECKAETLRRAHAVHPIAVAEIEVSLWSYEEETKKVIAMAQELGIAIAAYSPLGRGLLTGSIRSSNDLPAHDIRRMFTRFQEENIKHNLTILEAVEAVAVKKQVTPAQLAIAWVASLGPHVIPLPGSSTKKRTLENLSAGEIVLTDTEKAEIGKILTDYEVKGDRYFGDDAMAYVWG